MKQRFTRDSLQKLPRLMTDKVSKIKQQKTTSFALLFLGEEDPNYNTLYYFLSLNLYLTRLQPLVYIEGEN